MFDPFFYARWVIWIVLAEKHEQRFQTGNCTDSHVHRMVLLMCLLKGHLDRRLTSEVATIRKAGVTGWSLSFLTRRRKCRPLFSLTRRRMCSDDFVPWTWFPARRWSRGAHMWSCRLTLFLSEHVVSAICRVLTFKRRIHTSWLQLWSEGLVSTTSCSHPDDLIKAHTSVHSPGTSRDPDSTHGIFLILRKSIRIGVDDNVRFPNQKWCLFRHLQRTLERSFHSATRTPREFMIHLITIPEELDKWSSTHHASSTSSQKK